MYTTLAHAGLEFISVTVNHSVQQQLWAGALPSKPHSNSVKVMLYQFKARMTLFS